MAVRITLDKPRTIKFDLATILELETKMGGVPVGAIIQQLSQASVTAIVLSLWAGLKHEDHALTPAAITAMLEGELADGKSLLPLCRALNMAFEESRVFQGTSEPSEEPAPRRARGRR